MSEATELRLEGAKIMSVLIERRGTVRVALESKHQGQVPEEYAAVKLATVCGIRFSQGGDDVELTIGKRPECVDDHKKAVKVAAYLPGMMGEPDSRYQRLVQWMQAQVQRAEWELAPPNRRGVEPFTPTVEWIYKAPEKELFGGDQ